MAIIGCHKRVSKLVQAAEESYEAFLKESQQIREEREKHLEGRNKITEMINSTIEKLENQEKDLDKYLIHVKSVHGRKEFLCG